MADQAPQPQQYTVQSGDTLSGIATKYNLHSASLILANSQLNGNADMLHVGQLLTIPVQDATAAQIQQVYAAAAKTVAQKVTATKTTTAQPSTSTRPSNFIEPVAYRYISQGFNIYVHPGEDLVAPVGTPIKAIADGCITIEATGWNGGYGNFIMLNVGNGYEARYAHLSAFIPGMGVGSCVTQGTTIGYSGDTGNSTGPHVHFEIRLNGVPINPDM